MTATSIDLVAQEKEAKMMDKANWEGFGRAVMQFWPWGDIDGVSLQEMAEKYNVIIPVEGGFNSQIHTCPHDISEDGDPFYTRNYYPHANTNSPEAPDSMPIEG